MRGIYFINDKIQFGNLSKTESFQLQEQSLLNFLKQRDIQIVTLNPYQINHHYTIMHALLHDLKAADIQLDCLAFFSQNALDDFIKTYPARWLLIKSYFEVILPVHS